MPSSKRHLFQPDLLPGMTKVQATNCPICGTGNADFRFNTGPPFKGDAAPRLWQGWCMACTNVSITNDAVISVTQQKKEYLLSAYLRRLPAEDWDAETGGIIEVATVQRLTSSLRELTALDQFDLALKTICKMCPGVGQASEFDYSTDWPLLIVPSNRSARYLLDELALAGYLRARGNRAVAPPIPTWKAYERLQQIESSGKGSNAGFAAMSFSTAQIQVWYQVIKPGILEAGYQPVRVDQYEHNRRIDDEIISQIRRCRFLVADFTEQKKGVYFEAGFALGLGRNVIWMCKHSEVGDLHFDTRQFNHIVYDDYAKAKRDLINRIVALEGPGTSGRGLDLGS